MIRRKSNPSTLSHGVPDPYITHPWSKQDMSQVHPGSHSSPYTISAPIIAPTPPTTRPKDSPLPETAPLLPTAAFPVALLVGVLELDDGDVALVMLPEDVLEEEGEEEVAKDAGHVNDTLELARLQNCCEMFSAADMSDELHCVDMQLYIDDSKLWTLVALQ